MSGPLACTERGGTRSQQRVISGDYFRVVDIPLLEGRLFNAQDDASAPDRAVISKSLALRLFPRMSAIGQRISAGGRETEIIGVVGDVAIDNEGGDAAYVYHSHRQWAGDRVWALTQVVSLTTTRDAVERPIARAIASADPELVLCSRRCSTTSSAEAWRNACSRCGSSWCSPWSRSCSPRSGCLEFSHSRSDCARASSVFAWHSARTPVPCAAWYCGRDLPSPSSPSRSGWPARSPRRG